MAPSAKDIPTQAASIEKDLRALAAQAANEGLWPVVRAASLAAENLADIGGVGTSAAVPVRRKQPAPPPSKRTKTEKKRKSTASTYPRFESEEGDLLKIGWSRSEKAEYRHRAPEAAIDLVARAISQLADAQGAFTSDDLFPIIDPEDGSDVPTYQGYLVLRWFRELGLVEPNGRSEYIVSSASSLAKAASKSWKDLCAKENAR